MDDDVSHAVEDRLLALEERVTELEGGAAANGGATTEEVEEPDKDEE